MDACAVCRQESCSGKRKRKIRKQTNHLPNGRDMTQVIQIEEGSPEKVSQGRPGDGSKGKDSRK